MKCIFLFLSEHKDNNVPIEYMTPEQKSITGIQTNDAPVKWLISKADNNIGKVICLVTPEARERAFPKMKELVASVCGGRVPVVDIPFEVENGLKNDTLEMITNELSFIDSVMLDVTGGTRDVNMEIVLLSRVLSYKGIKIERVAYSNLRARKIIDITNMFKTLDLITGMHDFSDSGNAYTLNEYAKGQCESSIRDLIKVLNRLTDAISLCRIDAVYSELDNFNRALDKAEERTADPIMRSLLPVFRAKFGDGLDLLSLIKWCINSNMLQQALTLYSECMPRYIIESGNYVSYRYSDDIAPDKLFFRLISIGNRGRYDEECSEYHTWYLTINNFHSLIKSSAFESEIPVDGLLLILEDFIFIRLMRNLVNHASSENIPSYSEVIELLENHGYTRPDKIKRTSQLKTILLRAIEHLDICR